MVETNYEIVVGSSDAKVAYCSFDVDTAESKKMLYNAVNNPDYSISDFINKEIEVANIYVDTVDKVITEGENAGEVETKPRTVLIDSNGKTYIAGVSVGVYKAVKQIIRIFGEPSTWGGTLTVRVKQVSTARGNMLTLEVV